VGKSAAPQCERKKKKMDKRSEREWGRGQIPLSREYPQRYGKPGEKVISRSEERVESGCLGHETSAKEEASGKNGTASEPVQAESFLSLGRIRGIFEFVAV